MHALTFSARFLGAKRPRVEVKKRWIVMTKAKIPSK